MFQEVNAAVKSGVTGSGSTVDVEPSFDHVSLFAFFDLRKLFYLIAIYAAADDKSAYDIRFPYKSLKLFLSNSNSPSSRILQSSFDMALRSSDKKSASC